MLDADQLDSICSWARNGAALAETSLRESHADDSGVEIRELRCVRLSELPDHVQCFDGEPVAGAIQRFSGPLSGTTLLAMEPEDALTWVRANESAGDPVQAFLELAAEIQSRVIAAIGEGLGAELQLEPVMLEEESVPVILFNTHAPSDTVILAVTALVAAGDGVYPICVYMMLEPKLFHSVLAH
jgi:hypothetical protein